MSRSIVGEKAYRIRRWFEVAQSRDGYKLETNAPAEIVSLLETLIGHSRGRWTQGEMRAVFETLRAVELEPLTVPDADMNRVVALPNLMRW